MTESRARPGDHGATRNNDRTQPQAPVSEAGVARTYDRLAPLYDTLFGQVLEPGRKRMAQVVRTLQPASLLEVGVGTGLALAGYPAECKIVGIDLSHDMLERARERAAHLPQHNIAIEHMNAERMRFADGTFDCVTVPYVLSVTPRPAELVREIRRVCKPGGTIVVLNHFSGSKLWWLLERAVRSAAEHVGFRSDFKYGEQILSHDWQVLSADPVNLFGLSKLVVLNNNR
ncbi:MULTISPECIES: class I SAM-dependent methyltransferase [Variovorax]|uniref:class I SAM-dependent methyltransferase n=1 Tax=Variovorax TaxID=34072 RepID=UPI00285429F5|nr:methyltransferase domain-containing protein [Variovorax sp. 3319]MDR6890859.1 phosphatidylethanolamine/phosphatidyl-N-methylethanolamine N-methyltransferase [Variovorax sp. 3319]